MSTVYLLAQNYCKFVCVIFYVENGQVLLRMGIEKQMTSQSNVMVNVLILLQ
jgi:hypothetical protein